MVCVSVVVDGGMLCVIMLLHYLISSSVSWGKNPNSLHLAYKTLHDQNVVYVSIASPAIYLVYTYYMHTTYAFYIYHIYTYIYNICTLYMYMYTIYMIYTMYILCT